MVIFIFVNKAILERQSTMGKTKKSKKQTKCNAKQPHTPPTQPPNNDPELTKTKEPALFQTNKPTKDPTRKACMVILYEIDDQIRIMVPFGKRRTRRIMEARFVLAAPVTSPEETINDIEDHVCHHDLHTGPVF